MPLRGSKRSNGSCNFSSRLFARIARRARCTAGKQPAVRDPPPPLPGGYKVGEKVFFTGASATLSNGDELVHGQQGEVTGPATGKERDTHVGVRFPGNKTNDECALTEVRHLRAASAATHPPAPHTRDAAHAPCAHATASVLRRPSPHCMSSRSRRSPHAWMREGWWPRPWCAQAASVAAPEGAAAEPCLLTPFGWWLRAQVSRDAPPPLPGGYKVGEKVFYTGASLTWDDGDKIVHGQQGEVMGPGNDEYEGKGVRVRFPGNKVNTSCLLTEVRRLRAASAATLPPAPPTRVAAHAPSPPSLP